MAAGPGQAPSAAPARSACGGGRALPAAGRCSAASAFSLPGAESRAASWVPGAADGAGLRRAERCRERRGGRRPQGVGPTPRSAAPHPLQSAGPLQGGRGLLSSRAAGLGFSTPGFVPHFLFSCERLTSSWSLMPLTASLKRVVGKGGVGWTPAGVFF